jgi:hypothetical protein
MTTEPDHEAFYALVAEAKRLEQELKALLPVIAATRRTYFRSGSPEDRAEMERVQSIAEDLSKQHATLYDGLRRASGLPEEVLDAIDRADLPSDGEDRLLRKDLVKEAVDSTGFVEDQLPQALDRFMKLLPKGWASAEAEIPHRMGALLQGTQCLSLVRGLRPESEFSPLHRVRQMLRVAQDYQRQHSAYDHFAGATLVPQLTQFGMKLPLLRSVGGDVVARLQRLWLDSSAGADSTIFELLVAAGCAELGRNVEFIAETNEKSPDLRCHDPFPMVIECKRKRALSDYELAEEAVVRGFFLELESKASKKGMSGRFDLRLSVEARFAPMAEIVDRMISQRLAAHPNRPLEYAWGKVAYHPLPPRIPLPTPTRLYSPNMLEAAFGWNSDLPEWDGIVCRVGCDGDAFTDHLRNPIALVWNNSSTKAIQRRAWSPLDLFGDATNQIPAGEFGIIYLAYHEGARAEIADRRVERFLERMHTWDHAASIRIPISFLMRLYPRPLRDGQPDLIESTVRLCSSDYGEPRLFEDFPNSVFTNKPGRQSQRLN